MQRSIVKVNHFSDSLKSKHTVETYDYHTKQFLATNPNPKTLDDAALTEHIEGYLLGMKQSGLHSASYYLAYDAIHHYYTHKPNKRLLDWIEIKSVLGAKNHTGHKKGYKPEQIKKLLDVCDVSDKAKVGCLISGMRREAMCDIKLEDIKPIPEHGIYEIRIYPNTDSEQIAFTTPEATKWIQAYREKINPDYWLFPARQIIDRKTGKVKANLKDKQMSPMSVTVRFIDLSVLAGLRERKTDGTATQKAQHREENPAVHSLRHFARNAYKKARIPEENRKLLMGHSIGEVQKAYDDSLTDEELHNQLLQDFLSAVPYLTIDQSNELQVKVNKLESTKDKEISDLRKQMADLTQQLLDAGIIKKD